MLLLLLIYTATLVHLSAAHAVTCGSVLKLMSSRENARLHSHEVKYGSGSGQQSVTGMPESDDVNSHWELRPALKSSCRRGMPIECGQTIRLKHLTTGCLLHSHLFTAPLSANQEVSCFGKDGQGDTGDHWSVLCDTDVWMRDEPVRFRHVDTGVYLGVSGQQYGRPIAGQHEIVGSKSLSSNNDWKSAEGVFMTAAD